MSNSNAYDEWEALCQKFNAAREANMGALGNVNSKFSAVAQGASEENPSHEELSEFERTWEELEGIKKEMSNFVKKHTS